MHNNLFIYFFYIYIDIKYLGVENAEPREYVSRYGHSLRRTSELPSFVRELESDGQNAFKKIVHDANSSAHNELDGDVDALKYLDHAQLEREGLGQYRHYIINSATRSLPQQQQQQPPNRESHISHEFNNFGVTFNSDSSSANLHW